MPDGVMQWFDPATGTGVVLSGSRRYAAAAAEVDPHARHGGARVHFDVAKQSGAERAFRVVLRNGTRANQHHGRFGTAWDARPSDTEAARLERLHPELGRSVARHPLEVVRGWADALARGDLEAARTYYAPAVKLHLENQELIGRPEVSRWLEEAPVFSSGVSAEVRGTDSAIDASWISLDADAAALILRSRVEGGEITEQWIRETPPQALTIVPSPAGPLPLVLVASEGVDPEARRYAMRRLDEVVAAVGEPILFAQITLDRAPDPARRRPALVHVTLDVNGEPMRAHVAAHSMLEAIDLVEQRLRSRIEHRAEHRAALRHRTGLPVPGEWRRGDLPTERPEYYDRPVEERQLIHARSFAEGELSVDEAIFDMEQLGYDFYLFRDLASGLDAMVERAEGSYLLTALGEGAIDSGPSAYPLTVSEHPAPSLSVAQAMEHLNLEGVPFVGFVNAASGRGNVCYRRYDGHYGLISL